VISENRVSLPQRGVPSPCPLQRGEGVFSGRHKREEMRR